jgi:hypothetical protein
MNTIHNKLELDDDGFNAASPQAALFHAAIHQAKGYFARLLWGSPLVPIFGKNLPDAFLKSATLSIASFLVIWLVLITPTRLGATWSDPVIVSRILRDPYAPWIIIGALFLRLTPFLLRFTPFLLRVTLPESVRAFIDMFRGSAYLQRFVRSSSDNDLEVRPSKGLFRQIGRIVRTILAVIMFPCELVILSVFVLMLLGWGLFLIVVPLRLATIGAKPMVGPVGGLFIVAFNLTASACLFLILGRALSWRQPRLRLSFRHDLRMMLSACAASSFVFLVSLRFIRDGWRLRPPTPSQLAVPDLHSSIARYLAYSSAAYVVVSWGVFAVAFVLLLNGAVWPYIRRVISWAHKEGLPINRKAFVSAGLILLSLSTSKARAYLWELTSHQNLERIEEWIHEFK